MKKQSRLAVLLAAVLVCAMVCAGVALAAEVGMVETNASLDDFNNALSTDVVQAELVYNEILSKTALMDIFSVISNPDNNTGLYSLNVDQLNVLNQYVYDTYAAIESPSSMDEQCFAAITDQFQYIAYGYGVMLVADLTTAVNNNYTFNGGESIGTVTVNKTCEWKLNGNVTINGRITINNGATLTITGSGTLKRGSAQADGREMFNIHNGATLVVSGSSSDNRIIIDGNGNALGANHGTMIRCDDNLTLENVILQNNTVGANWVRDHKVTATDDTADNFAGGAITVCDNQNNNISIRNCIFRNNTASCGGGIYFTRTGGGTVEIVDTRFENCVSTKAKVGNVYGGGGAIFFDGRPSEGEEDASNAAYKDLDTFVDYDVDLTRVTIDGCNSAGCGSAIFMHDKGTARIEMTACEVRNCLSEASSCGTIRCDGNSRYQLKVEGCLIESNTSKGHGGGIYWNALGEGSSLTVNNTTIRNNTTTTMGGGMFVEGSSMTVTNTTITGNVAQKGGGIGIKTFADGAFANDTGVTGTSFNLSLGEGVVIEGNVATAEGGGISYYIEDGVVVDGFVFNYTNAGAIIRNNVVSSSGKIDGSVTGPGGGIAIINANKDKKHYSNTYVNSGLIENNKAKNGGGVYITVGNFELNGGTIRDHSITGNGGAFYVSDGQVTITNGTVENNKAKTGAGAYVTGGSITMTGGTLSNNATVSSGDGGGAYVTGGSFTISGAAEISGNTARDGAGAYVIGGDFNVNGGSLASNEAARNGGAIYVAAGETASGNLTMTAGSVTSNKATTNGGGAYIADGKFTMTGGSVTANEATNGAGAYVNGGNFEMSNGSINANVAATNGGAVYMAGGDFTMHHGNVNKNEATYGGAVYMAGSGSKFKMESGNMNENFATVDGGAIFATSGTLEIGLKDCTQANNLHVSPCHHPVLQNNAASVKGGGIAISNEGKLYFYCGNATLNEALSDGVGKNVFMNGGECYLYDGAEVGIPRDPDLVIVGGKLHNMCVAKEYIKLRYYITNAVENEADFDMEGLAELDEEMNLPDAQFFFTPPSDNVRFVGWTAKGKSNNDVADDYVRNKNQYAPSGTGVVIRDTQEVGEPQKTWDGAADDVMHLYALWAPITNDITYVDGLRGLNTETFTKITNNPTTYTNKAGKPETLTIQKVTKPGYELKGWYIYQDLDQNANWGYEPVEKAGATGWDLDYANFPAEQYLPVDGNGDVTLTVPELTFGNITLVAKWEEQIATYTYIAVGPTGSGYVGLGNDTASTATQVVEYIGQATGRQYKLENGKYVLVDPSKDSGEPQGSTAIANTPNYKFVAWYDDEECTVKRTEASKYAPAQKNGLYVTDNFYALFDFDVADLTITKLGLTGSDSAVFKVTGYNTASSEMQTWYITLSNENDTAIIKDMKIGSKYTITEMGGWSVYYATTDTDLNVEKTIQKFDDNGNNPNTVEITNTQIADKWLHDESYEVNFN